MRSVSVMVKAGIAFLLCGAALGLGAEPYPIAGTNEPVLYLVAYAHLDTQWRWDYVTTIREFIRNTLDQNLMLMDKYPEYEFTFSGAIRYEMMKDYYPAQFARMKEYVRKGRWHVGGSSVEEGDVNVPSPESVIRQVLYGNRWFRQELGVESADCLLPDCFGFPASMPSVLAHCGLRGFSTQKLSWESAVGIPFNIGFWHGPDGRAVLCAFNPGNYVHGVAERLDRDTNWVQRINENGAKYGVYADYRYYGTGDQGGAPSENSVKRAIRSIHNTDSLVRVVLASSDRMFRDISDVQARCLPRYTGDLLLTKHSAGSLTSQAYMKRWNRKNELLAGAAESAAAMADWLGAQRYPGSVLCAAWKRVLASQFHDILPGTSLPKAYEYAWNDEVVALNVFGSALQSAVSACAQGLDTRVSGQPLVVYNPLAIEREDVVNATLEYAADAPSILSVVAPDGTESPAQVIAHTGRTVRILFRARVAPLSLTVFDVRPYASSAGPASDLHVSPNSLENARYRLALDANGDVARIVDKQARNRELLAGPARLEFLREAPEESPAWNMDWKDRRKSPIAHVGGPAEVRVIEAGPVRAALEIRRAARGSVFVQRVRLAAGSAGDRVEFDAFVDWRSTGCCLKVAFPLAVRNELATYNLGLGTIQRGSNNEKKYEVPSHEWFDLTHRDGSYGVSVLEDCKFGSDKPNARTLRLTLLFTPEVSGKNYKDQYSQDWGRHDMTYAVVGHTGDWRAAGTVWQAHRLNQPLQPFRVAVHAGPLGRTFSFASVSSPQIDMLAMKKAEDGDALVVRLAECIGQPVQSAHIEFAAPVADAWEVDGQESRIGNINHNENGVAFNMTPYAVRSFAVRLKPPARQLMPRICMPVSLPFNTSVVTADGQTNAAGFDDARRTIPAELLQREITQAGVTFILGSASNGAMNAISCSGQTFPLPTGAFKRACVLLAAAERTNATFDAGGRCCSVVVPAWTGFIGQWDRRVWNKTFEAVDYTCDGVVIGMEPGYVNHDPVAWFGTHRHHPVLGNEPYQFCYLFAKDIPLASNANTLKLPDNPQVKIMALTLVTDDADAMTAQLLYDDFGDRDPIALQTTATGEYQLCKARKSEPFITMLTGETMMAILLASFAVIVAVSVCLVLYAAVNPQRLDRKCRHCIPERPVLSPNAVRHARCGEEA